MSSIRLRVKSVSIKPMAARSKAYGNVILSVSKLIGTSGNLNSGKPPAIEPRSPTVLVSILKIATIAETTIIAVSVDGIALVIFGKI